MLDKIRIKMLETVRPDFPFGTIGGVKPGTILRAGQEYEATSNPHGAVSGICENGETLGVKPGEFEFVKAPEELLRIHNQAVQQSAEMPTVKDFKQHLEETGLMAQLKAISEEIDKKKMAPMGQLLKVLEEHGEYCERCEADEPTLYYDPTGATVRCPFCGYSIKFDTLIKRARNLPPDYRERMIALPAKATGVDQVGDDVWITDGHIAEIAGDPRLSYPDRDKFKKTDAINKVLSSLSLDKYEEAKVDQTVYRPRHHYGPLIAILKSQTRTVYINNNFAEYIGGIYIPFIAGPLEPVLVKAHGKIRRIILPIRFDPERG